MSNYTTQRAKQLADLGYVAFAMDVYGKGVLELAFDGASLKGGVVSFHGMLPRPNLGKGSKPVKSKILVHHSGDDPFISKEVVAEFAKILTDAKVPFTFVSHAGAVHGFTRPGSEKHGIPGIAYNAKADYASFESMKAFFAENFK